MTMVSVPISFPTYIPSFVPTGFPTDSPITAPTQTPSNLPTYVPTKAPSCIPTRFPSFRPTIYPTTLPTFLPTIKPTITPTNLPTYCPSVRPIIAPSYQPTINPSKNPTRIPTVIPSKFPTASLPTTGPTISPSTTPTIFVPSTIPTIIPSKQPTLSPTYMPSFIPTCFPSVTPTIIPSSQPTMFPSKVPSVLPTIKPSTTPSKLPTDIPTEIGTVYVFVVSGSLEISEIPTDPEESQLLLDILEEIIVEAFDVPKDFIEVELNEDDEIVFNITFASYDDAFNAQEQLILNDTISRLNTKIEEVISEVTFSSISVDSEIIPEIIVMLPSTKPTMLPSRIPTSIPTQVGTVYVFVVTGTLEVSEIPNDPEESELLLDEIESLFVDIYDIPKDYIDLKINEDNEIVFNITLVSYNDALNMQEQFVLNDTLSYLNTEIEESSSEVDFLNISIDQKIIPEIIIMLPSTTPTNVPSNIPTTFPTIYPTCIPSASPTSTPSRFPTQVGTIFVYVVTGTLEVSEMSSDPEESKLLLDMLEDICVEAFDIPKEFIQLELNEDNEIVFNITFVSHDDAFNAQEHLILNDTLSRLNTKIEESSSEVDVLSISIDEEIVPEIIVMLPSTTPTMAPSRVPSLLPTINPSSIPSLTPSTMPTSVPSLIPTNIPTQIGTIFVFVVTGTLEVSEIPTDPKESELLLDLLEDICVEAFGVPEDFIQLEINEDNEIVFNITFISHDDAFDAQEQLILNDTLSRLNTKIEESSSEVDVLSISIDEEIVPEIIVMLPSTTPTIVPSLIPSMLPTNIPTFIPSTTPTSIPSRNPTQVGTIFVYVVSGSIELNEIPTDLEESKLLLDTIEDIVVAVFDVPNDFIELELNEDDEILFNITFDSYNDASNAQERLSLNDTISRLNTEVEEILNEVTFSSISIDPEIVAEIIVMQPSAAPTLVPSRIPTHFPTEVGTIFVFVVTGTLEVSEIPTDLQESELLLDSLENIVVEAFDISKDFIELELSEDDEIVFNITFITYDDAHNAQEQLSLNDTISRLNTEIEEILSDITFLTISVDPEIVAETMVMLPSSTPTIIPSKIPSVLPTLKPSKIPSRIPTNIPTQVGTVYVFVVTGTLELSEIPADPQESELLLDILEDICVEAFGVSKDFIDLQVNEDNEIVFNITFVSHDDAFNAQEHLILNDTLSRLNTKIEESSSEVDVLSISIDEEIVPEIIVMLPSSTPTMAPSILPSRLPTINPSSIPTITPSTIPTYVPSLIPTNIPTQIGTIFVFVVTGTLEVSEMPSDPEESELFLDLLEDICEEAFGVSKDFIQLEHNENNEIVFNITFVSHDDAFNAQEHLILNDTISRLNAKIEESSNEVDVLSISIDEEIVPEIIVMLPSTTPTIVPSTFPSGLPTINPSSIPTRTPSTAPTSIPSQISTKIPTQVGTVYVFVVTGTLEVSEIPNDPEESELFLDLLEDICVEAFGVSKDFIDLQVNEDNEIVFNITFVSHDDAFNAQEQLVLNNTISRLNTKIEESSSEIDVLSISIDEEIVPEIIVMLPSSTPTMVPSTMPTSIPSKIPTNIPTQVGTIFVFVVTGTLEVNEIPTDPEESELLLDMLQEICVEAFDVPKEFIQLEINENNEIVFNITFVSHDDAFSAQEHLILNDTLFRLNKQIEELSSEVDVLSISIDEEIVPEIIVMLPSATPTMVPSTIPTSMPSQIPTNIPTQVGTIFVFVVTGTLEVSEMPSDPEESELLLDMLEDICVEAFGVPKDFIDLQVNEDNEIVFNITFVSHDDAFNAQEHLILNDTLSRLNTKIEESSSEVDVLSISIDEEIVPEIIVMLPSTTPTMVPSTIPTSIPSQIPTNIPTQVGTIFVFVVTGTLEVSEIPSDPEESELLLDMLEDICVEAFNVPKEFIQLELNEDNEIVFNITFVSHDDAFNAQEQLILNDTLSRLNTKIEESLSEVDVLSISIDEEIVPETIVMLPSTTPTIAPSLIPTTTPTVNPSLLPSMIPTIGPSYCPSKFGTQIVFVVTGILEPNEVPSDSEEIELFFDIIEDVFVELLDIPKDFVELAINEENMVNFDSQAGSYDDALSIQKTLSLNSTTYLLNEEIQESFPDVTFSTISVNAEIFSETVIRLPSVTPTIVPSKIPTPFPRTNPSLSPSTSPSVTPTQVGTVLLFAVSGIVEVNKIPSDPEESEVLLDIVQEVFVELFDLPEDFIDVTLNDNKQIAFEIQSHSYDDALIINDTLTLNSTISLLNDGIKESFMDVTSSTIVVDPAITSEKVIRFPSSTPTMLPTLIPTEFPTTIPSSIPSLIPTKDPSYHPTKPILKQLLFVVTGILEANNTIPNDPEESELFSDIVRNVFVELFDVPKRFMDIRLQDNQTYFGISTPSYMNALNIKQSLALENTLSVLNDAIHTSFPELTFFSTLVNPQIHSEFVLITPEPTILPSVYPTTVPTIQPTPIPTIIPTLCPSRLPTISAPTQKPSQFGTVTLYSVTGLLEANEVPSDPKDLEVFMDSVQHILQDVFAVPEDFIDLNLKEEDNEIDLDILNPSYDEALITKEILALESTISLLNDEIQEIFPNTTFSNIFVNPEIASEVVIRLPSSTPTLHPSTVPTCLPSIPPSQVPTFVPTSCPSRKPSIVPTKMPSTVPYKLCFVPVID